MIGGIPGLTAQDLGFHRTSLTATVVLTLITSVVARLTSSRVPKAQETVDRSLREINLVSQSTLRLKFLVFAHPTGRKFGHPAN